MEHACAVREQARWPEDVTLQGFATGAPASRHEALVAARCSAPQLPHEFVLSVEIFFFSAVAIYSNSQDAIWQACFLHREEVILAVNVSGRNCPSRLFSDERTWLWSHFWWMSVFVLFFQWRVAQLWWQDVDKGVLLNDKNCFWQSTCFEKSLREVTYVRLSKKTVSVRCTTLTHFAESFWHRSQVRDALSCSRIAKRCWRTLLIGKGFLTWSGFFKSS